MAIKTISLPTVGGQGWISKCGYFYGGVHLSPTATHSCVIGQQTSSDLQSEAPLHKVPGLVGVKQCFAAGQQYSVFLHTVFGLLLSLAPIHFTSKWKSPSTPSAHTSMLLIVERNA